MKTWMAFRTGLRWRANKNLRLANSTIMRRPVCETESLSLNWLYCSVLMVSCWNQGSEPCRFPTYEVAVLKFPLHHSCFRWLTFLAEYLNLFHRSWFMAARHKSILLSCIQTLACLKWFALFCSCTVLFLACFCISCSYVYFHIYCVLV